MFSKVLIANRGEIALRIIRACRVVGTKSVAVYSEADANSPHLEEADEKICIGPGPSSQSYLNQEAILEAAAVTDSQAVHPGFGFLSENASFARRCEQHKLAFIGPRPQAIRLMGDKAVARQTMKDAGLPVMPGSKDVVPDVAAARQMADSIGYPVLLKASAGGGGRGMRRVNAPEEVAGAFDEASREALKAFANPDLYMEKYIVGGRHIEFQILADHYGNVIHLGERECSVQRNHQKLIEEAPASRFPDSVRLELGEKIRLAVQKLGYRNAGTIEFLMDSSGQLYFMEMNTRIQVEHPVTECVTGIDLVAWQIRIACGERLTLKQSDIRWTGHAIECRLNAEDPAADFRPAPGLIEQIRVPTEIENATIRFDSHVRDGYRIPGFYDSMIGKLIVHAADRATCVSKLKEVLEQLEISGPPTTLALHRAILGEVDFANGNYDCQYLPSHPQVFRG